MGAWHLLDLFELVSLALAHTNRNLFFFRIYAHGLMDHQRSYVSSYHLENLYLYYLRGSFN